LFAYSTIIAKQVNYRNSELSRLLVKDIALIDFANIYQKKKGEKNARKNKY
jgi:hypothetical protein